MTHQRWATYTKLLKFLTTNDFHVLLNIFSSLSINNTRVVKLTFNVTMSISLDNMWTPINKSPCTACTGIHVHTNGGLAESNGSLPPGGWLTVTCKVTDCTPGSAPGPMLGVDYGKPLPFYLFYLFTNGAHIQWECLIQSEISSCSICPKLFHSITWTRIWTAGLQLRITHKLTQKRRRKNCIIQVHPDLQTGPRLSLDFLY